MKLLAPLLISLSLAACVSENDGDELSPDAGVTAAVTAEGAKCELRVKNGRNVLWVQGTYEVSMEVGQYLQVTHAPQLNVLSDGFIESIYYYCPGWSAVAWNNDSGYVGWLDACRRDAGQPAGNTVVWEYAQELTAAGTPAGSVFVQANLTTTPYLDATNQVDEVRELVDCVR